MLDRPDPLARLSPFEIGIKGLLRNARVQVTGLALLHIRPGWSDAWSTHTDPELWRIYWNDRPMRLVHAAGVVQLPARRLGVVPPLSDFRPCIDAP
ncbi:MAG: hypothetical protein ACOCXJ_04845, partial [Planctomycetota bacterium]